MGYKNLECFEYFKSLFCILKKNNSNNNNKYSMFVLFFSKIQKSDLKNFKYSKFLYPTRSSYEIFNANHKLKFLRF
jgi:hypothetical protein